MIRAAAISLCALAALSCGRPPAPVPPRPAHLSATAPLPAAAQEALDRGIAAASSYDYQLAIRHFNEARELAPGVAIVYLNLGVAESLLPGRYLRAVAWFGAYLTAYPDAPNAASVAEEIAILERANRADIARLIAGVKDAIDQLPLSAQGGMLEKLAGLYASAGDSDGASRVVGRFLNDSDRARVRADIAAAEATARTATARTQLHAGDVAAARETLSATVPIVKLIEIDAHQIDAALALAVAQTTAGDIAGARDAFAIADDAAERNTDPYDRSRHLTEIGAARFKAGDVSGGRATFERARAAAAQISTASQRDRRLSSLVIRRAEVGDLSGARKTVEGLDPPAYAEWSAIAEAEARTGDLAAAVKTTARLAGEYKSVTLSAIAETALASGEPARARPILAAALESAHADDRCCKSRSLARAAAVQWKAGDVAGATATLKAAKRAADHVEWNEERGFTSAGGDRRAAQRGVARAEAELRYPELPAKAWLDNLEATDPESPSALSTEWFLDLAAHLKRIPASDDPRAPIEALHKTTARMIRASAAVRELLERPGDRS